MTVDARYVCTSPEMRRLEEIATESGSAESTLMETAGAAIFREIRKAADPIAGKAILVLVGPGNNGGDGLVISRHLALARAAVTVLLSRARGDDPLVDLAESAGAAVSLYADGDVRAAFADSDLVVDCLLGIGSSPPIRGSIGKMLREVAGLNVPLRIACDIPSGTDADTGAADEVAFNADLTIAAGPAKAGTLMYPARALSGVVVGTDIGLPAAALKELPGKVIIACREAAELPDRAPDSHKGSFGKVVVLAGNRAYRGAAALACIGAARSGAGLITLASIEPVIAATAARISSVTYRSLSEIDGHIAAENADSIADLIEGADSVVIGPGIGRSAESDEFVRRVVASLPAGMKAVVDADGLNACGPIDGVLNSSRGSLVLTPHPGEMARLLGIDTAEVQSDRLAAALRAAAGAGQVVVLKGAGSIVAEPSGAYAISPVGAPALAHAGSGDVLAGAIASLLAQGLEPAASARLGVGIHASAGEKAGESIGAAGTTADDLPDLVASVLRELRPAPQK